MPLTKPYFRCWRPNLGREGRSNLYIYDPRYVENPGQHLRSVEILYNDLRAALDYIEPADANNAVYSFRLRDLLMRICTEIEAEFKEILAMNSYSKGTPDKWDMRDFYQLNATHHLSSYELQIPYWNGIHKNRIPFSSWHNQLTYKSLPWYKAYNSVKHNRFTAFQEASLGNVIDAFSGLLVLLAAEFHDADCLKPIDISYVLGDDSGYHDGYEDSIGSPFRIKRPQDWTDDEKFDFDWQVIKDSPFQSITSVKKQIYFRIEPTEEKKNNAIHEVDNPAIFTSGIRKKFTSRIRKLFTRYDRWRPEPPPDQDSYSSLTTVAPSVRVLTMETL